MPHPSAQFINALDHFNAIRDQDMMMEMPLSMSLFGEARRIAYPRQPVAEQPPPAPKPNAERYPTLGALGFIFSEALDLGPVVRPPTACECCGRLRERIDLRVE